MTISTTETIDIIHVVCDSSNERKDQNGKNHSVKFLYDPMWRPSSAERRPPSSNV